jgi:hypothetical protein
VPLEQFQLSLDDLLAGLGDAHRSAAEKEGLIDVYHIERGDLIGCVSHREGV